MLSSRVSKNVNFRALLRSRFRLKERPKCPPSGLAYRVCEIPWLKVFELLTKSKTFESSSSTERVLQFLTSSVGTSDHRTRCGRRKVQCGRGERGRNPCGGRRHVLRGLCAAQRRRLLMIGSEYSFFCCNIFRDLCAPRYLGLFTVCRVAWFVTVSCGCQVCVCQVANGCDKVQTGVGHSCGFPLAFGV